MMSYVEFMSYVDRKYNLNIWLLLLETEINVPDRLNSEEWRKASEMLIFTLYEERKYGF